MSLLPLLGCLLLVDGPGGGAAAEEDPFVAVEASNRSACALTEGGVEFCSHGEMDGRKQMIRANYGGRCGLLRSGRLDCTGDLSGVGEAPDGEQWVFVDVGYDAACAIDDEGAIDCWGSNTWGQARPPGGEYRRVSLGWQYGVGLDQDDELVWWGYYPEETADELEGQEFVEVAVSFYEGGCALADDGEVSCWGGWDGQAPRNEFDTLRAGWSHFCGMRTDGVPECWGDDSDLQLDIPDGSWVDIDAGWNTTCGLREDGDVQCWGAEDTNW